MQEPTPAHACVCCVYDTDCHCEHLYVVCIVDMNRMCTLLSVRCLLCDSADSSPCSSFASLSCTWSPRNENWSSAHKGGCDESHVCVSAFTIHAYSALGDTADFWGLATSSGSMPCCNISSLHNNHIHTSSAVIGTIVPRIALLVSCCPTSTASQCMHLRSAVHCHIYRSGALCVREPHRAHLVFSVNMLQGTPVLFILYTNQQARSTADVLYCSAPNHIKIPTASLIPDAVVMAVSIV